MGGARQDLHRWQWTFIAPPTASESPPRKRDEKAILQAASSTLSTCVACHAVYRQEFLNEATWQRLTAQEQSPTPAASTHAVTVLFKRGIAAPIPQHDSFTDFRALQLSWGRESLTITEGVFLRSPV